MRGRVGQRMDAILWVSGGVTGGARLRSKSEEREGGGMDAKETTRFVG